MKTSLIQTSALLVCFLSILASCKKDDEVQKSRNDLLIGSWNRTAYTIAPSYDIDDDGDNDTDILAVTPACRKDDFYTFSSAGLGQYNEGNSKCQATHPQTVSFDYELKNSGYVLIWDGSMYSVDKLDETSMVITSVTLDSLGVLHTFTENFTKRQP